VASQPNSNRSLVLLDKKGNEVEFTKRSRYKHLWIAIKDSKGIHPTNYKYTFTNMKRVLRALDIKETIEKPQSKLEAQEWTIVPLFDDNSIVKRPRKGSYYNIAFYNKKRNIFITPETYKGALAPVKWSETFHKNMNRFLSDAKGKQFIIYVDKHNKLSTSSKTKALQVWKISGTEAVPLTVAAFKLTAMELIKQEAAVNVLKLDNSNFEPNKMLKDKNWDKSQLILSVTGNTVSELFNKLSIDALPPLKDDSYEIYILEARLILRLEDGKMVSHATVASESPSRLKAQLVRELVQDIRSQGYTFTKVTTINGFVKKAEKDLDYDLVHKMKTVQSIVEEHFEIIDRHVTLSANLYKYNSITGEAVNV